MPNVPVRPMPFPIPNPLRPRPANAPLTIDSIREFAQHQDEILQRINAMSNGATLFSIHPVQAMQDVGITLSTQFTQEYWKALDTIAIPVPAAYRELKKSTAPQRVTTRLVAADTRGGR